MWCGTELLGLEALETAENNDKNFEFFFILFVGVSMATVTMQTEFWAYCIYYVND